MLKQNQLIVLFALLPVLKIKPEVFEQGIFFYHPSNKLAAKRCSQMQIGLDVSTSTIIAKNSFDPTGEHVPLFGKYGNIDFNAFAKSSLAKELVAGAPVAEGGVSIYDDYEKTKNFKDKINTEYTNTSKEKVFCAGKLQALELEISLSFIIPDQPFFVGIDLPLRYLDCTQLKFVNISGKESKFTAFLNEIFDDVLEEHNFVPLAKGYQARGISDVTIKFGWSGEETFTNSLVQRLWCDLSAGAILPLSMTFQPTNNFMFHIPLGGGGAFGTSLKYAVGTRFNQSIELVLFGENETFFQRKTTYQLLHNKNMGLFNFFEKAKVNESRGSFWELGGTIKSRLLFEGLFATFGYSYHSQEASLLQRLASAKEDNVFGPTFEGNFGPNSQIPEKQISEKYVDKNALAQLKTETDGLERELDYHDRQNHLFYQINDYLINKDPRLQRSYSHIFHFSILAQPEKSPDWCDQAKFAISYHHPFFGKSSFAGYGFSGQAGVSMDIKF